MKSTLTALLAATAFSTTCQVQAVDYAPYGVPSGIIVFDYTNAKAKEKYETDADWSPYRPYRPFYRSNKLTFTVGNTNDHLLRFNTVNPAEYIKLTSEPSYAMIRLHGIEYDIDCYLRFTSPTTGFVSERHYSGGGDAFVVDITFKIYR